MVFCIFHVSQPCDRVLKNYERILESHKEIHPYVTALNSTYEGLMLVFNIFIYTIYYFPIFLCVCHPCIQPIRSPPWRSAENDEDVDEIERQNELD